MLSITLEIVTAKAVLRLMATVGRILAASVEFTESVDLHYLTWQLAMTAAVAAIYAAGKAALGSGVLDGTVMSLVAAHFFDLLAPIALLGISNAVFCLFRFRVVALAPLLGITSVAAFSWEVIAPLVLPQSVADPVDFAIYLLGGFLYWLLNTPSAPLQP